MNRLTFLSPGPISLKLIQEARTALDSVEVVTDASEAGLSEVESPFDKTELAMKEAVQNARIVFIESNCSRALSILDDIADDLSTRTVLCDLLPVKGPFEEYLTERADVVYIGLQWIRPSAADNLSALVRRKEPTRDELHDLSPELLSLTKRTFTEVSLMSISEHDRKVAENIQLPGLLESDNSRWGCQCRYRHHPALQYDALIANQSHLLDVLSKRKSDILRLQNHLISEDQSFFDEII